MEWETKPKGGTAGANTRNPTPDCGSESLEQRLGQRSPTWSPEPAVPSRARAATRWDSALSLA